MKRYLDFATFPLVEEKDLMMVVTEQLSILTLEFLLIKQLVQFSARGFNLRATGESQSFFGLCVGDPAFNNKHCGEDPPPFFNEKKKCGTV